MRILFLAPRHPNPPLRGDQRRVFNLATALSNHADVRLLTFGAGEPLPAERLEVRPLSRSAATVLATNVRRPLQLLPLQARLYLDQRMQHLVADTIESWRPDVVHLTLARTGPYMPAGGQQHVHVDFVDSLARNMRSRAAASPLHTRLPFLVEARLMARYEARLAAQAATISVVSAADARQPGLERATVIPNGVDAEAFDYVAPRDRPPVLLFFGNLGYFHNVAPAQFVAREVLPRVRARIPAARLRLAGARPAPGVRALAGLDGVEMLGPVDDMVDVLHAGAVAVLPMFSGSGIKNKVLEAMAAGTPVVANKLGVEGVDGLVADEHHIQAESADALADAAVRLLQDADLRCRLAEAGRRHVVAEFSWDAQARRLMELYAGGRQ